MLAPAHRAAARGSAGARSCCSRTTATCCRSRRRAGRIAVIGALADDASSQLGSWRARRRSRTCVTLRAALEAAHPDVDLRRPQAIGPPSPPRAQADLVVLVVGEDFDRTGEARSLADIGLPGAAGLLAAVADTGKPVVVVLMNGRPLAIPSGRARRRRPRDLVPRRSRPAPPSPTSVRRGQPAGRLPATFPRASGAVPFAYDQLPSGRPATRPRPRHRPLPRPADHAAVRVRPWPQLHHLRLTARSTLDRASDRGGRRHASPSRSGPNTGARRRRGGPALPRDPVASVSRPVMELRGFRRIALQPGETRTGPLHPDRGPVRALGRSSGGWPIEPGEIELMAGAASDRIATRATLTSRGGRERHAIARVAAGAEQRRGFLAVQTPSVLAPLNTDPRRSA